MSDRKPQCRTEWESGHSALHWASLILAVFPMHLTAKKLLIKTPGSLGCRPFLFSSPTNHAWAIEEIRKIFAEWIQIPSPHLGTLPVILREQSPSTKTSICKPSRSPSCWSHNQSHFTLSYSRCCIRFPGGSQNCCSSPQYPPFTTSPAGWAQLQPKLFRSTGDARLRYLISFLFYRMSTITIEPIS